MIENEVVANDPLDGVRDLLKRTERQLRDAMRELEVASERLVARSVRGAEDVEAMLDDKPCSLTWVDWVEQELRMAKDARAKIEELCRMKRALEFALRG